MDVETIEYNSEIIRIESEMMGFIGLGYSIHNLIESIQDLDEGLVMTAEW